MTEEYITNTDKFEDYGVTKILHDFTEEDWKLIRPRYSIGPYVGGSEVPSIMNCGYVSSYTLMRQKLQMEKYPDYDDPDSDMYWIIKRGKDLEPILLDDAAQLLGLKIHKPNCMVQHPHYQHMIADLDGITEDGWIVEVKVTQSRRRCDLAKIGKVPPEYMVQGDHYLTFPRWNDPLGRFGDGGYESDVKDKEGKHLETSWIPSNFGGIHFVICHDLQRKPAIISIPFMDRWGGIDDVIDAERHFIKMFNQKILPEPDGHESTTESLKSLSVGNDEVAPTPEHMRLQREYHDAKEKVKLFNEQASAASNKLKAACGDNIRKIKGVCAFHIRKSFKKDVLKGKLQSHGLVHLIDESTTQSTAFRIN